MIAGAASDGTVMMSDFSPSTRAIFQSRTHGHSVVKTTANVKPSKSHQHIILHNLTILFDLFVLFGFKLQAGEIEKNVPHYTLMVEELKGDWMGVFKYKTAAFFAAWMNSDILPPNPFSPEFPDKPTFLVGGRAARWLSLHTKAIGGKDVEAEDTAYELLSSIINAKKGFEKPNAKILREKELSFFQTITAVQPEEKDAKQVKVSSNYTRTVTLDELKDQIIRTVIEIFEPTQRLRQKMTKKERMDEDLKRMTKAMFPSTSANYINSRADAGSVSAILENEAVSALRKPGGYLTQTATREEQRENEDIEFSHNRPAFEHAMALLWFRCLKEAKTEPNNAIPVALAEALKVRVITKGPPFKMYVLKYVQKQLHSTLRKIPQFALIGSPWGGEAAFHDYLEKVMKTKDEPLERETRYPMFMREFFVSGDYKAATDAMKSWASEIAATAICNVLDYPEVIRELIRESLTGYTIEHKGKSAKQTIGQLMGSIISFPILCIVNAAATRFAMEVGESQPIKLTDCRMAINGDDVVFRANDQSRDVWRQVIGMFGLEESIGKTYYSDKFLQINSRNFIHREGTLTEVPFVNMGLLTGQTRSGSKVSLYDQDSTVTFGMRYRALIAQAPPRLRKEIHRKFVEHNKATLESCRLPWYIPEWIGGLGITGVHLPSELDLRIAQRILFNWKKEQPYALGSTPSKWKIWDLARQRLPKPFLTKREGPGVEAYTEAVDREAMNLLLDSNVGLEQLLVEEGDRLFITRKIRKNEKMWKPGKGVLPKPIDNDLLQFKKVFESTVPESFLVPVKDLEDRDIKIPIWQAEERERAAAKEAEESLIRNMMTVAMKQLAINVPEGPNLEEPQTWIDLISPDTPPIINSVREASTPPTAITILPSDVGFLEELARREQEEKWFEEEEPKGNPTSATKFLERVKAKKVTPLSVRLYVAKKLETKQQKKQNGIDLFARWDWKT
jgi:hypothetical protein